MVEPIPINLGNKKGYENDEYVLLTHLVKEIPQGILQVGVIRGYRTVSIKAEG